MRVYVVVEGQTEEAVVKDVLCPHLAPMGVYLLPVVVHTSPGHSGGGRRWAKWENDIRRLLKQEKSADVRVTTIFDLFRLPKDFPGLDEHGTNPDTNQRCDALQAAMTQVFDDRRFIPYLQRHELEALVLASLDGLAGLLDGPDAVAGLSELKAELGELLPEDVDGGPQTAPSKRLQQRVPGYRKVLHGPMAIDATGLPAVRGRCPRFNRWIVTLEGLAEELQP